MTSELANKIERGETLTAMDVRAPKNRARKEETHGERQNSVGINSLVYYSTTVAQGALLSSASSRLDNHAVFVL